ncbi:MAG: hypothetical protein WCK21_02885 [Actinomycetota bacterium]
MRVSSIEVSATGITRTGHRQRALSAAAIRRLYLYTDSNGDEALVARGPGLRLQFISRRELLDPAVRRGVNALIDAVHTNGEVDANVPAYLASLAV